MPIEVATAALMVRLNAWRNAVLADGSEREQVSQRLAGDAYDEIVRLNGEIERLTRILEGEP